MFVVVIRQMWINSVGLAWITQTVNRKWVSSGSGIVNHTRKPRNVLFVGNNDEDHVCVGAVLVTITNKEHNLSLTERRTSHLSSRHCSDAY